MALQATIHRLLIQLSDVDRGVYEALDLRVARHPSESMRYMLTRTLAYALSYEEGIAFSKGGISDTEEAPVSIRDMTGVLLAWIDVGSPSTERLHKATKLCPRVAIFTHSDLTLLRREAGKIHKAPSIDVQRIDVELLDQLEPKIERHTSFDLTRNDGRLYITLGDTTLEGAMSREPFVV